MNSKLATIAVTVLVLALAAGAGIHLHVLEYNGCSQGGGIFHRDEQAERAFNERVRAVPAVVRGHNYFDLCVMRHGSTHCYGGIGEPWGRLYGDAVGGFR
jgi:hypothetical protein